MYNLSCFHSLIIDALKSTFTWIKSSPAPFKNCINSKFRIHFTAHIVLEQIVYLGLENITLSWNRSWIENLNMPYQDYCMRLRLQAIQHIKSRNCSLGQRQCPVHHVHYPVCQRELNETWTLLQVSYVTNITLSLNHSLFQNCCF